MLQVALRYRWLPWQRGGNVIRYVDRQQNGGRHDLTFSMNEQGDLGQGDIEDRPPRSGVGNREKPAELAIGTLRGHRRRRSRRASVPSPHHAAARRVGPRAGQGPATGARRCAPDCTRHGRRHVRRAQRPAPTRQHCPQRNATRRRAALPARLRRPAPVGRRLPGARRGPPDHHRDARAESTWTSASLDVVTGTCFRRPGARSPPPSGTHRRSAGRPAGRWPAPCPCPSPGSRPAAGQSAPPWARTAACRCRARPVR